MTAKSPIGPNNNDTDIVDKAAIYINKKTVQFGQEVYQFHNITGFGVSKVKTGKVPILVIAGLFILGLFSLNLNTQAAFGFVIAAIVCIFVNLGIPQQYGLGLYLNSGQQKIFVTSDQTGLRKVVESLYKYMNSDENQGTYVVTVVRGNINGNYIGGNAVNNNLNFQ